MSAGASLVAQTVRNQFVIQETQVQSLGQEDMLEEGMPSSSTILPGEFCRQKRLVGYSPWSPKE